jgi:hypothetical protein
VAVKKMLTDARAGKALFAIRERKRRGPGRYRGADVGEDRTPPPTIEIGPPIPDRPLPTTPPGAVGVQPWGVLPAKPPGRKR